jgi:hypothetical protein
VAVTARGRLPAGTMNRLEAKYADHLAQRKLVGEVAWFSFEAVKLRLAAATFYSPDFLVMLADGSLEVHETKGFMRDDAAVKIKVAAQLYPFRFFLVRYNAGWHIREV